MYVLFRVSHCTCAFCPDGQSTASPLQWSRGSQTPFCLLWWCLHCSALKAMHSKMRWLAQKMLKIFSSLCYTKFTTAKVWQENEEYFSEKPTNWSVLPEQSYEYGRFESFVVLDFQVAGRRMFQSPDGLLLILSVRSQFFLKSRGNRGFWWKKSWGNRGFGWIKSQGNREMFLLVIDYL